LPACSPLNPCARAAHVIALMFAHGGGVQRLSRMARNIAWMLGMGVLAWMLWMAVATNPPSRLKMSIRWRTWR